MPIHTTVMHAKKQQIKESKGTNSAAVVLPFKIK